MTKSLMRSVTSMAYKVIIMPPAKRRLDMEKSTYRVSVIETSDPCAICGMGILLLPDPEVMRADRRKI